MQRRILWPVIGCVVVLVASIWVFGGHNGLSFVGGMGLTLGIVLVLTAAVGIMAVIFYGRRSRRDRSVGHAARHDD
ncbi:hypothetical protein [Azospirillum canadense]|uniref:hypothetical protein n=1 Tax=Azospirillum canadense TaxID=403962 RepID=UPI002226CCB8|nr:hypothetical protein [Azospirillum canadense]MCW2239693.1 putative membrane protein [Azospirillum canadense]